MIGHNIHNTTRIIALYDNIRNRLPDRHQTVRYMKTWTKIGARLKKIKNNLRFLLRCKNEGYIPSYILNQDYRHLQIINIHSK